MATFNTFSDILPDPANPVTNAGSPGSGTPGPGFSALGFTSVTDTQVSRTQSGRGVTRDGGSQRWEFNISYNPMFRSQFEPVFNFLMARNPRRDPFYVILPQYSKPRDTVFANFVASRGIVVRSETLAGSSVITLNQGAVTSGTPMPGDMFTITDPNDFNHQKMYRTARVETNSLYQAGTSQPATNQVRLHISPPLQRTTSGGARINFINPKFRVIAKGDVQEYQLNTENLYSFSLACEELQA